MRFFKLSFIILSLSVCFSSCSKRGSLDGQGLPAWVFDDSLNKKGEMSAVGMADDNPVYKVQYAIARNDAYANLGQKISSYINRIAEEALDSTMTASSGLTPTDQQKSVEAKQSFSQKTKVIVKDLNLNGVSIVNLYKDPKSGVLYVKVSINEAIVNNFLAGQKEIYKNDVYNRLGTRNAKAFDENISKALTTNPTNSN